jgi:two-component system chemotaxis sensor kinase CheA
MAADPYRYFRVEGRELHEGLSKGVLELESGSGAPDLVPRLLRLAHTLKGAARVVKLTEIADLAHALEDALIPLRDGGAGGARGRVEGLLALVDAVNARLRVLDPVAKDSPAAALEAAVAPRAADMTELDALLEGVTEVGVQLGAFRRAAATLARAGGLAASLEDHLERGDDHPLARELRRLLALMERELGQGVEQADRELRQVRGLAERLRLVPAAGLLDALERTARDAAHRLGKAVAFESRGGDVRLEAQVMATVQGALVQAVRNAVAHGIESAGERTGARKPTTGKVVVEIERRGSRVIFTCRDDGRGIDLAAVRRVAERRGLAAGASERELITLLLEGGISTSASVNEVAGRGVGLDVVRDVARRLGGQVAVKTGAGEGTSVSIDAPVSLAALDALVVEVDGQALALPLACVRQSVRLGPGDVARVATGEAVLLEGKMIPFSPLDRTLGRPRPGRSATAVLIEGKGGLAAVGVDRLLGTENVVVRPLPAPGDADPVVAGASLDQEGNPQLVLDSDALVAATLGAEMAEAPAAAVRPPILVIDDSLTTRMLEQSILEAAGYEVDTATSAEEGHEKALLRRYGLYLVDVEMPGMDGFSFVEKTRADPQLRQVPAILVTSRNAPEDKRRGEAVGASAYVVKSEFNQVELLARIRRLVGA